MRNCVTSATPRCRETVLRAVLYADSIVLSLVDVGVCFRGFAVSKMLASVAKVAYSAKKVKRHSSMQRRAK